jgi:hypothetical protein
MSVGQKTPQRFGGRGQSYSTQTFGGELLHKPIHLAEGDLAQGHVLFLQPFQQSARPPTVIGHGGFR